MVTTILARYFAARFVLASVAVFAGIFFLIIAVDYIEKIDAMGGMLRAIETGYVQNEIQDAAFDYQRSVETNSAIIVGVNKFQSDEETAIPILKVDEKIEREQVERLQAIRAKRNAADAANAIKRITDAVHRLRSLAE